MEIKQVWAVYWSATGNTRKVVEETAKALADKLSCPMNTADFTPLKARETGLSFVFASHDLAPALSVCTSVWALGRDGVFRSSDALPAGSDADCSGAESRGSSASGSNADCSGAGSRFAGLIETIFSDESLMNRDLPGGGIFK